MAKDIPEVSLTIHLYCVTLCMDVTLPSVSEALPLDNSQSSKSLSFIALTMGWGESNASSARIYPGINQVNSGTNNYQLVN